MNHFARTFPRNALACFQGRMFLWHLVAALLTFTLVTSGFDWVYFKSTRSPALRSWMWPGVPIGGLLPILLPLFLLALGAVRSSNRVSLTAWAIAQAEIIGALIIILYKALTGRVHPSRMLDTDITRVFRFGFLRGGVFWGWPSSHTAVAFAMAVTVFTLFPKQRWLGWLAIAYAFYVGIGVSMTIHWFTDFAAGAIIGSIVGFVVGRSFAEAQP